MKRSLFVFIAASLILFSSQAYALLLFEEDFESDLSNWVGKEFAGQNSPGGFVHHGVIVDDPVESDHALAFTELNSWGDIFTEASFTAPSGHCYILSFDYLGMDDGNDYGGFVGYSYELPGYHVWLAGTQVTYPGLIEYLPDNTNAWHHVEIAFSVNPDPIRLMFEDFTYSFGVAGDAYFDNIRLETAPVPEPATMLLLGTGLVGLAGFRKKFKK